MLLYSESSIYILRGLGLFMGMNKSVLRFLNWLELHPTVELAPVPFLPATSPLNHDGRPVKWVPDGTDSWRIVWAD